MDPLTIAMVVGEGLKAGKGIYDLFAKDPKRPDYEIPSAYKALLATANKLSGQYKLPGQDLMEEKIRQSVSDMAARAASDKGGQGYYTSLVKGGIGANNAMKDLAIAGAERYDRNQAMLMNVLGQYGQQQEKQFQYNEWMPYQQKYGEYREKLQAGATNLGNATDNVMNMLLAEKNYDAQMSMIKYMFGGNKRTDMVGQDVSSMTPKTATSVSLNQTNTPQPIGMRDSGGIDWQAIINGVFGVTNPMYNYSNR